MDSRGELHSSSTTSSDTNQRPGRSTTPTTPRKNKSKYSGIQGDRFIPNRDGSDLQSAFQLISDEPLTPGGRNKRKMIADLDLPTEEANETFSMLLSSELFGVDSGPNSSPLHSDLGIASPSRSTVTSPTKATSSKGDYSLPTTPSKRNLLSFRSPQSGSSTPTRSLDRRMQAAQLNSSMGAGMHESLSADRLDTQVHGTKLYARGKHSMSDAGLFGGLSCASGAAYPSRETSNSPIHTAYSTSPVKPESQRILMQARKPARSISKVPYKVLDAPELADDFYLNLVDWSKQDVLGVGLGRCVYLWSAATSSVTKLCDLQNAQDSITGVSWSDRGHQLAIGTDSGLVQIWDVEKQKLLRTMMGHSARVGALTWNNYVLSTGSRDRIIYHRDVRVPAHHIKTLLGHRQEVCGLRWDPTQEYLASGGNDNKLLVWDEMSETPLYRFHEHTAAVKAIAWSPHQQGLLASGGGTADMKIRFWNTQTGVPLSVIDTESQVCNLAWNKTSNEIISTHGYSSGQVHNQIQLWRYPSLSHVATLTGHTMRVLYLAMSPNGNSIVTGAGDETLRFWDLNNPKRDALHKRENRSLQSSFVQLR
ncbi:substrate-specific activator of APC-dependent proteolysis [Malassezia yamatoensis]|uniref:Substrate-specific activator of APC-dependent proteolysis n=1 Tax=Malassezia yamatoensis TaxID=253288 RepID=A0AAJ5YUR7_9BASI|nr:substrate-specific activator of APC-dependent proteolysis [Malassezia yamatoensis]